MDKSNNFISNVLNIKKEFKRTNLVIGPLNIEEIIVLLWGEVPKLNHKDR